MSADTRSLFPSVHRFKKKPVVIEAMPFTKDTYTELRDWLGHSFAGVAVFNGGPKVIRVRTLEGVIGATRGDWIVKGVAGEFYPVKPDIFEQTYEGPVIGNVW